MLEHSGFVLTRSEVDYDGTLSPEGRDEEVRPRIHLSLDKAWQGESGRGGSLEGSGDKGSPHSPGQIRHPGGGRGGKKAPRTRFPQYLLVPPITNRRHIGNRGYLQRHTSSLHVSMVPLVHIVAQLVVTAQDYGPIVFRVQGKRGPISDSRLTLGKRNGETPGRLAGDSLV